MREIKLEDVRREVRKAYEGSSCDQDCVDCEQIVRGKYERWFSTSCYHEGYLAIVDCSDSNYEGEFLCPILLRDLIKYGERKYGEDDEIPEKDEDDGILEYVRLV